MLRSLEFADCSATRHDVCVVSAWFIRSWWFGSNSDVQKGVCCAVSDVWSHCVMPASFAVESSSWE